YLETVCTDAKLDLATSILLNETESSRPFKVPSFVCESLDVGPSGFGVTSVVVFVLDAPSAWNVFQIDATAIVNYGVVWPNYSLMHSSVKQMDMHFRKLKIRFLCDFVDDDDVYPLKSGETTLSERMSNTLSILQLMIGDVERVVCRYICSKFPMLDSSELPPDINRFSLSKQISAQVADCTV
ncbi:hypothetical protein PHMEG_00034973, partial [Phytophthora megakarya]